MFRRELLIWNQVEGKDLIRLNLVRTEEGSMELDRDKAIMLELICSLSKEARGLIMMLIREKRESSNTDPSLSYFTNNNIFNGLNQSIYIHIIWRIRLGLVLLRVYQIL
jgi:hypothetical protein